MVNIPKHTEQWHRENDGYNACIYGHEYIEGNYAWRNDKDGRYRVCLYCESCYAKGELPTRETPDQRHATVRNSHVKTKYGVSAHEYNAMLAHQGGLCAVCAAPPSAAYRLSVDMHGTTFAGLLCRSCLSAARMLKNSALLATNLTTYLITVEQGEPAIPDAAVVRESQYTSPATADTEQLTEQLADHDSTDEPSADEVAFPSNISEQLAKIKAMLPE